MRAVLLLAAGCLICQAGFAAPLVIKLSRANTSYSAFLNDRDACLQAASHNDWKGFGTAGPAAGVWTHYDVRAFAACMNARGYLLDPNGYRAIQYQRDGSGRELVVPL